MTTLPRLTAEMADLLEALCLEELSPADAARLEELVCTDPQCCRQYIIFVQMHALAERFDVGQWGTVRRERVASLPGACGLDVSVPGLPAEQSASPGPTPEPLVPPLMNHY